ncbi:MAG: nicotinate-nucleotide adenylyltransferase [Proteobacteria bacterium]|nr:nicotinate-nucleotide adenylyltransferase [Pseudomonadota bacterium]MDA1022799.1 nicotinate-nucleotide adenylyltransferase [Pseudomonadota bacterium]
MTEFSSFAATRPGSFGNRRARVGILGGSFNPAHTGHLHISRLALKLLKLDEIWWLVSPQNPLKPQEGMASLEDRLKSARSMARGRQFRVTGMEQELGTQYTADTLKALKTKFSKTRFVWIMGADNLIDIARWNDWMEIFQTVPVAVFGRPAYSFKALFSQAARRFARNRLNESRAALLVDRKPPAWVFLHIPLSTVSATRIRAGGRT